MRRGSKHTLKNAYSKFNLRSQHGKQLLELLVAITVGGILMMSTFGSGTAMYRASASGENQVLASSMAQQVIDNARNSTFRHLRDDVLNGAVTVSQEIPLYQYPPNPATAPYPRPLLRNEADSNMVFTSQSTSKIFNGTVKQTITNLAPGEAQNGLLRVDVLVEWRDSRGPHTFSTGTTIAQTGIHN